MESTSGCQTRQELDGADIPPAKAERRSLFGTANMARSTVCKTAPEGVWISPALWFEEPNVFKRVICARLCPFILLGVRTVNLVDRNSNQRLGKLGVIRSRFFSFERLVLLRYTNFGCQRSVSMNPNF